MVMHLQDDRGIELWSNDVMYVKSPKLDSTVFVSEVKVTQRRICVDV